jgi:hypothetical protein
MYFSIDVQNKIFVHLYFNLKKQTSIKPTKTPHCQGKHTLLSILKKGISEQMHKPEETTASLYFHSLSNAILKNNHPWKELQRQSLELRRKDGPDLSLALKVTSLPAFHEPHGEILAFILSAGLEIIIVP